MLNQEQQESMGGNSISRRKQPWRDALIATTGLSVFTLAASLLWNSGYPEWAFALSFLAVWVLISVSWSNIDFTEQSGTILARIMDNNFSQMHRRVEELEQELSRLKDSLESKTPESANAHSSG